MCISPNTPRNRISELPEGARREAFAAKATLGGGTQPNAPRTPKTVLSPVSSMEVGPTKGDTRLAGGMKL